MWWPFVAQVARCGQAFAAVLLAQACHFAQQQVDLVLLRGHELVQRVQQIFGVTELDLKLRQPLVGVVGAVRGGFVGGCHGGQWIKKGWTVQRVIAPVEASANGRIFRPDGLRRAPA